MPPGKISRSRRTAPIDFPEAMVVRPTLAELADFPAFIKSLEAKGAHLAGICKVIPPEDYVPRKIGYNDEDFHFKIETPLKQIFSEMPEKGSYQTKCMTKQPMTVKEYHELTNRRQYMTPSHDSHEDLEKKYWRSLSYAPPIYGADVTESITDKDVTTFNVGALDSILNIVAEETDQVYYGVNSPYVYFGMWRATFSWHVEDMDLYGINFLHHGDPKTWYCVPPKYGYLLERAARELFPNVASWCSNFMRHKTCLISPRLLEQLGVPFQKVVQEERAMIIVFPYAYHSGFNHGYNIAESTNFASERWVEYGKRHRACDCNSNRVKIDMGIFVKKFQPELYDKWVSGKDIAPHPEDPDDVAKEIKLRAENPEAYAKMLEERRLLGKEEGVRIYKTLDGKELPYDVKRKKLRCAAVNLSDQELARFNSWTSNLDETKPMDEECESSSIVMVDIYEHIEMARIHVKVFRDTKECLGDGLALLREFLCKPDLASVRELIDRGDMIKIGQKILTCDPRKIQPPAVEVKKEEHCAISRKVKMQSLKEGTLVHVYKHTCLGLEAMVNPETSELFEEPPEKLKNVLGDMTFKELTDAGVFMFSHMAFSTVEEEDSESDLSEDTEERVVSAPVEIHLYEHVKNGIRYRVYAKTKKFVGRPSDEARAAMGEKSLAECIEDGTLKFLSVQETQRKKTFKSASASKSSLPTQYKVYAHKEMGVTFTVNPENFKILGRKSARARELLKIKSIDEMIRSGELTVVGDKLMKNSENGNSGATTAKSYFVREPREGGKESSDKVDAVRNASRVVYRYKSAPTLRDWLAANTFENLLAERKLEECCDPVEKQSLLNFLLNYDFKYAAPCVTTEPGNATGKLKVTTRPKGEDDLESSEQDVGQLEAKNVLLNPSQTKTLCKKDLKDALAANGFADRDQIRLEFDARTKVIKLSNLKDEVSFVIKEEKHSTKLKKSESQNIIKHEETKTKKIASSQVKVVDLFLEYDSDLSYGDDDDEEDDDDVADFDDEADPDFLTYADGGKRKRGQRRESAGAKRQRRENYSTQVAEVVVKILEALSAKEQAENGSEVEFDKLIAGHEDDIYKHTIKIFVPMATGLRMLREEEGRHIWLGQQDDNIRNALRKLLDLHQDPMSLDPTETWLLCATLLKLLMIAFYADKNEAVDSAQINSRICWRESLVQENSLKNVVHMVLTILTSLSLVVRTEDKKYRYNGPPSVYDEWQKQQFEMSGLEPPKRCLLSLKRAKTEGIPLPPSQRRSQGSSSMSELRKRIIQENAKLMGAADGGEAARSLKFLNRTCKCGGSRTEKEKDGKKKVRVGFKKRIRCKECPGCMAKKCGNCIHCLNPQNKQSCMNKICSNPILPKCPCFQ